MKILVVGAWHLGAVNGVCMAEAGHQVWFWDQDPRVMESWRQGKPPIFEPGLDEIVKKHWGHSLHAVSNLAEVASQVDAVVLAYDTPVDEQDRLDLRSVEEGFFKILKEKIGPQTLFLFTAQLPVGTSRRFLRHIKEAHPQWQGHVLYQPENLRLGEAIKSFTQPDRVVLGMDVPVTADRTALSQVFRQMIGNQTVTLDVMNLESAEMVKHALNSFLATCVVFANEVSVLCEQRGADAWDVMASLKKDSRVGPRAFLRPGLGFSGGTLARDVRILSEIKDSNSGFFSQLYRLNQERDQWVVDVLKKNLKPLVGKTVLLLGVTYKPQTSTVRRSPAIALGALLKNQGVRCVAVDPKADVTELTEQERAQLPFELVADLEKACTLSDAAVLVTEWPQFLESDWQKIAPLLRERLIVDTKNFLAKLDSVPHIKRIVPGKPQEAL